MIFSIFVGLLVSLIDYSLKAVVVTAVGVILIRCAKSK
jgi:hypothetical protein